MRRSKNCRIENRFRKQIKMKSKNMKTTTTLMAAIVGMALFAGAAYAQYKTTADDGITASPKLRERLTAEAGISTQPAAAAAHRCAMCKDEYTTRVDQTAKGLMKPAVLFVKHLCPGCETITSVQGQGKAAQNVVAHKCAAESTSCCTAENACCAEKEPCCAAKEACCASKT
jgi:hypothetical protein